MIKVNINGKSINPIWFIVSRTFGILLVLAVDVFVLLSSFPQYLYLKVKFDIILLLLVIVKLSSGISLTAYGISWFIDLLRYFNIYRLYRLLKSLSSEEFEEFIHGLNLDEGRGLDDS